ncbi:MAG: hypothetical protein SFV55_06850 [Haliscomenobacter sp.]|uniref:hypothetical protein n=1 Tax=Haliscomenobacter sp. TaxID=2717303 RepID=UPI0029B1548A|nr:hypothetical protein [Haliscomenobacter sp.]MDX2068127.1 hypothetical protein [Haliscomenobacter sp.]
MKISYLPLLGLFLTFLPSCSLFRVGSGTGGNLNAAKKVTFCQLGEYNEQLIKTRLIYSGVEEYWSASGFEKCDLNHRVYVNFDDYYEGWKWLLIRGQLSKIHNKYDQKIGLLNVIGRFEMVDSLSNEGEGFGHLGLNKAQIVVKSVRIKVKKK